MAMTFGEYVRSGRFNKVANEAVAEAIAQSRAHGLKLEGRSIIEPKRESEQRAQDARSASKKPARLAKK